jgi:hypothetical protein
MSTPRTKSNETVLSRDELRTLIIDSLQSQGYEVGGSRPMPPQNLDKARVRALNAPAVEHRREAARHALERSESSLLTHIAAGGQVDPRRIKPTLVAVRRGSTEELLFRYVSKHWSIPVSSGYGRRLRFLVVDDFNEKLIGIIGLADPVINLGVRDKWIGWTSEAKTERLRHVMDAFVIGAVPPYSSLLCGKLVAMLAASTEVRRAFEERYAGRSSLIRNREFDGQLALLTTSSALGRSSIYNRLTYQGRPLFKSIGYTQGYGEFHFANGLYEPISRYAAVNCQGTERNKLWGKGFRNRREVIRKVLMDVGLTSELVYHGVQREVFAVPLVNGVQNFLQGKRERAAPSTKCVHTLSREFMNRWLLSRLDTRDAYKSFDPETYRLWTKADDGSH